MRIRPDGSVQSADTPTHQNSGGVEDYGLYRCMVTSVTYVDDPQNVTSNSTNPRVLYEVVVLGGFASGQIISNCRLASTLGGNYNFYERTLRASSKSVTQIGLSQNDGDIVYVMFIQGRPTAPVIVGLDQGINTGSSTGANRADGQIDKWQFNGIFSLIDASGDLTWIRHGGKLDSTLNAFVPDTAQDVKLEVGPQKVTVTMKNGTTVTIDGNSDDVKIKTSGGGELHISGGKVALGAGSTELLQQISDQLTALQTAFTSESSHTHIGNLGYPTAPPSNAGDMSSAASTMGTIKGKVDSIKGTL